jgi:hypothetical protein
MPKTRYTFDCTDHEENLHLRAFKELLKLNGADGDKIMYSAMDKLLKKYQNNAFKAITQQNLC